MGRGEFTDLQIQSVTAGLSGGASPIGVFSFNQDGQYYLGWHNAENRISIPANPAWARIASTISPTGGSFLLRGYDVLLYRQKYKGYIVPVRIQIID